MYFIFEGFHWTYELDVIYFQLDKDVVVTNGVQRVNLILYLFVLTVKIVLTGSKHLKHYLLL